MLVRLLLSSVLSTGVLLSWGYLVWRHLTNGMDLIRGPFAWWVRWEFAPSGSMLTMAAVHYLIASLLAGVIVLMAMPAVASFWRRVRLSAIVGLFATVALYPPAGIWWTGAERWKYVTFAIVSATVGWILVGLIHATLLKPRTSGSLDAPSPRAA